MKILRPDSLKSVYINKDADKCKQVEKWKLKSVQTRESFKVIDHSLSAAGVRTETDSSGYVALS